MQILNQNKVNFILNILYTFILILHSEKFSNCNTIGYLYVEVFIKLGMQKEHLALIKRRDSLRQAIYIGTLIYKVHLMINAIRILNWFEKIRVSLFFLMEYFFKMYWIKFQFTNHTKVENERFFLIYSSLLKNFFFF